MARPTDSDRVKQIRFGPRGIVSKLKEAPIDRLALDFCSALDEQHISYAIIGGYVAILLGRPRESDDVDIFAEPMNYEAFAKLHSRLCEHFDCLSPGNARRLFADYLDAGPESTSVRYAQRDTFVPNIEFKFARKRLDFEALEGRLKLTLNGSVLAVGPLESQIAFKLYMGSPKDFEDARWIYRMAANHIDAAEIKRIATSLKVPPQKWRKILDIN